MGEKFKFRKPLLYKFLYTYVSVFHRLYYKKITVVGFEKIPTATPIIFAPNHQNALMDALAVDFASRKEIAFMARADIFKKPAMARILNMLRILPIYRIRDGFGELGRNQEVFDYTVQVLKSNIPLCILPEGNHDGQKRLRPLKKGIFRISFQAEESVDFNLNLHIVPVGLDYSDYFNAGADLIVVFGTPIRIADYRKEYLENEPKAINTLVNTLSENMKSVMIHIPEDHYNLIYEISEMYEPNVWNTCNTNRHPYNKLTIKQYIIQKATEAFSTHPEKAPEIVSKLEDYKEKLNRFGIKDCFIQQKQPRFLILFLETLLSIVLLPLQIYGTILNYLPFMIPTWIAAKTKDQHFKSSIQFGIGMFVFPIFHLILFAIFCFFTNGYLIKLLFGLSLPISGLFAFYNYKHMQKLFGKLKLFIFKLSKTEKYRELVNTRTQLIDLIKTTINN